jgi:hypothetical protein
VIVILGPSAGSQPLYARDCVSEQNIITPRMPSLAAAINPHPSEADLELPMPCGGKLVLHHVCVPARGYFGDLRIDLGCQDCGRPNQSFMEGKHGNGISGPFYLSDGAFRSADIGFRAALSGILTSQGRWERFDQQWADTGLQQLSIQAMGEFSGSGIGMTHNMNPITEIDRLMNAAGDGTNQKKLFYLRKVLKNNKISLKKQKSDYARIESR